LGFSYNIPRISCTVIHAFGALSVLILAVMDEIALLVRGRTLGRSGRGRAIREQAGLSLRELARIVQVDAATLSRWERGDVRPRQAGAARWLTACDAIERELESSR
jgi:DNA-binding XRE family transcriptional regulator